MSPWLRCTRMSMNSARTITSANICCENTQGINNEVNYTRGRANNSRARDWCGADNLPLQIQIANATFAHAGHIIGLNNNNSTHRGNAQVSIIPIHQGWLRVLLLSRRYSKQTHRVVAPSNNVTTNSDGKMGFQGLATCEKQSF
jgi:hypothetical protein